MGARGPLSGPGPRVYDPAPVKPRPPHKAWPAETKEWWKAISSLPHTVDWMDADWSFARMTALVHARAIEDPRAALLSELRVREERLGATETGRARLGIRYEEPAGKPQTRRRSASELRLVDDVQA